MNFIKKNLKILIAFIIGIVLASVVAVFATINANSVDYTNNKNVSDALNELYNKSSDYVLPTGSVNISTNGTYNVSGKASAVVDVVAPTISLAMIHDSNSAVSSAASFDFFADVRYKYKYFKITNIEQDSNVANVRVVAWSQAQSAEINLDLNQEYEILSTTDGYRFSGIFLHSYSKSSVWSRSKVTFTLYNK